MTHRTILFSLLCIFCGSRLCAQQPADCKLWSQDIRLQQKYDEWTFKRNLFYKLVFEFKTALSQNEITEAKIQRVKHLYDSLAQVANTLADYFSGPANIESKLASGRENSNLLYSAFDKLYDNMVAYKNSLLTNQTSEDGLGESLNSLLLQFLFREDGAELRGTQIDKKLNCLKWKLWDAIN